MLEEQQMNIFQRFQKWYILRRMNKTKDGSLWQNIKNPILKYDREIIEQAWNISLENGNIEELKEFPQHIKIEKAMKNETLVSAMDNNTQFEIALVNKKITTLCSEEVQKKLVEKSPEEYLPIVSTKIQKECMPQLTKETQINIMLKYPELILFASKEVKEERLITLPLDSREWLTILQADTNLTLNKIMKYWENSNTRDCSEIITKYVVKILNKAKDKEKILEEFNSLEIEYRRNILNGLIHESNGIHCKPFDPETEKVVAEMIIQNEDLLGLKQYGHAYLSVFIWSNFRIDTIYNIFKENYGENKLEEYREP